MRGDALETKEISYLFSKTEASSDSVLPHPRQVPVVAHFTADQDEGRFSRGRGVARFSSGPILGPGWK
jgi:hypothetical protein